MSSSAIDSTDPAVSSPTLSLNRKLRILAKKAKSSDFEPNQNNNYGNGATYENDDLKNNNKNKNNYAVLDFVVKYPSENSIHVLHHHHQENNNFHNKKSRLYSRSLKFLKQKNHTMSNYDDKNTSSDNYNNNNKDQKYNFQNLKLVLLSNSSTNLNKMRPKLARSISLDQELDQVERELDAIRND
jgi:hypothetical protein